MAQESDLSVGKLMVIEYERLKEEQLRRIGIRDNLIYATLASLAAVVAITVGQPQHHDLLLLLPPVCVVLGWTYLVNDQKVSAIGQYVRRVLRPKLADLLGEPEPLGWELAHRSDRLRMFRKYSQLAVDLMTFCLPAVCALIGFWVMGRGSPLPVAISVLELLIVLGLAIQIVIYADLGVGDNEMRSSPASPQSQASSEPVAAPARTGP